jgi:hypothetical protein
MFIKACTRKLPATGVNDMAYEIYVPQNTRNSSPQITLTKRGTIVFNVASTKALREAGIVCVNLMWDAHARKFAFRSASPKDKYSFRLRFGNGNKWAMIAAKGFLRHIGHDTTKTVAHAATWNRAQEMLEAQLEEPDAPAEQHVAAAERPALEHKSNGSNGSATRKQEVIRFIQQHGPSTKGEIMAGLDIPPGTAAYVLNDKTVFVNRDGRWNVVA